MKNIHIYPSLIYVDTNVLIFYKYSSLLSLRIFIYIPVIMYYYSVNTLLNYAFSHIFMIIIYAQYSEAKAWLPYSIS